MNYQLVRAKGLDDLTIKDFKAFERVRAGGRYNMLDERAEQATGLDTATFKGVMENYGALSAKADAESANNG